MIGMPHDPGPDFMTRRTGRSTCQAMHIIAAAMATGSCAIEDHFGTTQANRCLMQMILDCLGQLGFEGFSISRPWASRPQLHFNNPATAIKIKERKDRIKQLRDVLDRAQKELKELEDGI